MVCLGAAARTGERGREIEKQAPCTMRVRFAYDADAIGMAWRSES